MALERMQVTNHERWGNLVKTWSTGKNYLDDDNEYPIPTTVDEFKEQLAKAQVFMTVPDRYHQGTVRRAAHRTRSWCACRPPWRSPIPKRSSASRARPIRFRRSTSACSTGSDPVIPEADKFKVHAERIGDYTISFCA